MSGGKQIHLKVYGLPRTGTNAIAYNIMRTWPEVRVWLDSGPEEKDHSRKEYWRHGRIKIVPGVVGYIITSRRYDEWLEAVTRYKGFDERYARWIVRGFDEDIERLVGRELHVFCRHEESMRVNMQRVDTVFRLPKPSMYHIEGKYMRRNDDSVPLDDWTTDEVYRG